MVGGPYHPQGEEKCGCNYLIVDIQNLLSDFYEITEDYKVIPKSNIELIEETEKLADEDYQKQIAFAIYTAVVEYLAKDN